MHTICNIQKLTKKPSEAKLFAEKVFDDAIKAKKEYSEKLLFLYGYTPKWYIK